jgi:hypothetical protein
LRNQTELFFSREPACDFVDLFYEIDRFFPRVQPVMRFPHLSLVTCYPLLIAWGWNQSSTSMVIRKEGMKGKCLKCTKVS